MQLFIHQSKNGSASQFNSTSSPFFFTLAYAAPVKQMTH
ncbi:hypothetical protein EBME_1236 [bacterium endosymbiont of Mortierella elongata FMR23-6]|nr:hypothetical protein EBME_1236 [bacterium endosymbiont of Mortierella elongata FMR23-6]